MFGEHELLVRAVDAAGNVDLTPAEWSWEIGGTAPPVLIESGPDLTTERPQRALPVLRRRQQPDLPVRASTATSLSPCLPGKAYNGLPLGPHTFEVQRATAPDAIERAAGLHLGVDGHRHDRSRHRRSSIGPPDVTAGIDPEASGEADGRVPVHRQRHRARSSSARIDGELFEECENPFEFSGLALGDHLFRVRAVLIDPTTSA